MSAAAGGRMRVELAAGAGAAQRRGKQQQRKPRMHGDILRDAQGCLGPRVFRSI